MTRKSVPITCREFVSDGNGGYKPLEDLTPEEKTEFFRKITNRMGAVFNDYFGLHPEVYAKL